MDINNLYNSFYISIKNSLDKFSKTKFNSNIYALVFDCDSIVGQICLRYSNISNFNKELENLENYKDMYKPYGKYGLRGYKYSVGHFLFIDYEQSTIVKNFLDSYYYYETGDYYGEGCPIEGLENNYIKIWKDMILYCISKLKTSHLELNITDNFIIYMCDHDQSNEEIEKLIKLTVDEKLFYKLLNDSYL